MAGNSKKPLRILMYPWFAMGHLTPYTLTANRFAERGHTIFIIVPPTAQAKLGPFNLHPELVEFKPVSIPRVEGLPSHVETTNDIPIHKNHLLMKALTLTEPVIEALIQEIKPDLVFTDVIMHWLPGLARKLQIRSVAYCTVSPASIALLLANLTSIENGPPYMKMYAHVARQYMVLDKEIEVGVTRRQIYVSAVKESDAIAFTTCMEIEGLHCEFLENEIKKPVMLAGPIIPKPRTLTLDKHWAGWLGRFGPKSMIYCAFGSEVILGKDQFQQLLLGIELTGLPFLIALRTPFGAENVDEALPEGFAERTEERGVVHGSWVPQQLILNHPSVGCFVTHCGSGSMWEGLTSECQLVALPQHVDQYVNARFLSAGLGAGVEVEKGDVDGLFTKEGVHSSIMAVMAIGSEIGKEVKANHDELRELLARKGFGDAYFDDFVEKLRILASKASREETRPVLVGSL